MWRSAHLKVPKIRAAIAFGNIHINLWFLLMEFYSFILLAYYTGSEDSHKEKRNLELHKNY